MLLKTKKLMKAFGGLKAINKVDFELPKNEIRVIDTPGIKGFGLVDFDDDKLSNYFVEFSRLKEFCKFKDCNHINEPDFIVKKKIKSKSHFCLKI